MATNLTWCIFWFKITRSLINILTGGYVLISLVKNIKRLIRLKEAIFIAAILIVYAFAVFAISGTLRKEVRINDDGRVIEVKTFAGTVGKVLEENNIDISADDYISMAPDEKLQTDTLNEINIKRAVPVKIVADGKETTIMTAADTVGEALKHSPVRPSGLDKLKNISTEDKITKDLTIEIIRVKETLVTETESIPFKTVERKNSNLDQGVVKTVQKGMEGKIEKQYRVVAENGVEVKRELLKEVIIASPVNAIKEIGTLMNVKTARGDVLRAVKVLNMSATAYTSSYKCTGKKPGDKGFGITRTGIKARKGVIAVDPKVIPLGTRVYVEILGNTPDYGYAIAADTGGAIKGNKIDLYYDSEEYVEKFGVKKVKVYILPDN